MQILNIVVWVLALGLLITVPAWLLWNLLISVIFGLPPITLWQALGVGLLSSFLFFEKNRLIGKGR